LGRFVLLVFLLLPIVEIALFILVGQAIGLVPTLLAVIAAALGGALVVRMQGLSLLADIRKSMSRGEMPGRAIADAMMVGVAGILLLLPGFFTDVLALLLLIPPFRSLLYGLLAARVVVVGGGRPAGPPEGPRVIDLDDSDYRPR